MHDLNLACVDQRSQDLILTSLVEQRVIVRFCTVNADDLFVSILWKVIDQELGLQFAHFLVVERHIKIEIAIGD